MIPNTVQNIVLILENRKHFVFRIIRRAATPRAAPRAAPWSLASTGETSCKSTTLPTRNGYTVMRKSQSIRWWSLSLIWHDNMSSKRVQFCKHFKLIDVRSWLQSISKCHSAICVFYGVRECHQVQRSFGFWSYTFLICSWLSLTKSRINRLICACYSKTAPLVNVANISKSSFISKVINARYFDDSYPKEFLFYIRSLVVHSYLLYY